MSRTARLWKGAGLMTLGGVLLSGVVARGEDGPPLASQLNDLGRQALAQGATSMAQTFFQKALQLDPGNAEATRGLKDSKAEQDRILRVAFQDAAGTKPATPPAVARGRCPADRRRRNRPRSRKATAKKMSSGNSSPTTSSSGSRRRGPWWPRANPRRL